jgi:hypothetical protein
MGNQDWTIGCEINIVPIPQDNDSVFEVRLKKPKRIRLHYAVLLISQPNWGSSQTRLPTCRSFQGVRMRQRNAHGRDRPLSRLEKAFTLRKGVGSRALSNSWKTGSFYSLTIYTMNDKSKEKASHLSLSGNQSTWHSLVDHQRHMISARQMTPLRA